MKAFVRRARYGMIGLYVTYIVAPNMAHALANDDTKPLDTFLGGKTDNADFLDAASNIGGIVRLGAIILGVYFLVFRGIAMLNSNKSKGLAKVSIGSGIVLIMYGITPSGTIGLITDFINGVVNFKDRSVGTTPTAPKTK